MDPLVAKGLAKALYARNSKLGASLSSEQKQETKQALEQAIRLNPRDPSLLNVYVDFLSDREPEKAVALRQTIQTNAPSADNALMLAKLAAQIALNEKDETKKNAFFTMAETAFEAGPASSTRAARLCSKPTRSISGPAGRLRRPSSCWPNRTTIGSCGGITFRPGGTRRLASCSNRCISGATPGSMPSRAWSWSRKPRPIEKGSSEVL